MNLKNENWLTISTGLNLFGMHINRLKHFVRRSVFVMDFVWCNAVYHAYIAEEVQCEFLQQNVIDRGE